MDRRRKPIDIDGKSIGRDFPPFVIAEMSGNHNQSLERALQIVEAAAESGVDAIKLQTYTADTMTLDIREGEFLISDPDSLWTGKTLYELYDEAHTPWEWHKPIFDRANELGLIAFSTAFDNTSVDFLESLDVPCYKIASFENTDISLIKRVAATGKPMIISTGMATVGELDETVREARQAGCDELILLKCTSTYPASPNETNILTIPHMQGLFGCEVGLSDHTMGIGVATASVALGARVIEKHFTLSRSEGGVDAVFSLEPGEMKMLVAETKKAWQALGCVKYAPANQKENQSRAYKRSIYVSKDINVGERFTKNNICCIRPSYGLAPKYYEELLGRKAAKNVIRGTALQWNHINKST
ncbi:MAG: pseudaminic acid synthase [Candidatus Electrothrix sp. AUS1_2]|nr:pseudaminic acid synthase [Candidatus Electrothrix sp. AUS1_2]